MSLPPNRDLFAEFKGDHRVLVETGFWRGDGVQAALNAGYEEVHSIDVDRNNIDFGYNRFDLRNNPDQGIFLLHGDSANDLKIILDHINEPITFWLDSHWQMFDNEPQGPNPWPLLAELAQIRNHPVKTHTIIIDDMLVLTHPGVTGWTRDMIENHLLWINPSYQFKYFSNPVIDSILVAHV